MDAINDPPCPRPVLSSRVFDAIQGFILNTEQSGGIMQHVSDIVKDKYPTRESFTANIRDVKTLILNCLPGERTKTSMPAKDFLNVIMISSILLKDLLLLNQILVLRRP